MRNEVLWSNMRVKYFDEGPSYDVKVWAHRPERALGADFVLLMRPRVSPMSPAGAEVARQVRERFSLLIELRLPGDAGMLKIYRNRSLLPSRSLDVNGAQTDDTCDPASSHRCVKQRALDRQVGPSFASS